MHTIIRKKLDSKTMIEMFNDFKIDIRYFVRDEKDSNYYNITIRHSEAEHPIILLATELGRIANKQSLINNK